MNIKTAVSAMALTLALVPGLAFAATPVSTAAVDAGCVCGNTSRHLVCTASFAQPLFRGIADCATQAHGCLGNYVDADGNGVCDNYESGYCQDGGACLQNDQCPQGGSGSGMTECPGNSNCPTPGQGSGYGSRAGHHGNGCGAGAAAGQGSGGHHGHRW